MLSAPKVLFVILRFNINRGILCYLARKQRGLPKQIRTDIGTSHVLRLPMQAHSRSLNLSNSVSIVAYEAWRQLDFAGSLQPQGNADL